MIILDSSTDKALYLQLYEQIKHKITTGQLPGGSRLPAKRQLAKDLNISKNTVESTYQQLVAEGFIKSKTRSGFYVEKLEHQYLGMKDAGKERQNGPLTGMQDNKQPVRPFRYDFQYGRLADTHFPAALWAKLHNYCLQTEQQGLLSYGDNQGEIGLRREIARYILEYRGVVCQPEQVVVGAGTQHCLGVLCQLLNKHAGAIAVEDPGYSGARAVFRSYGFAVIPAGLEDDGINIGELAAGAAQAVYVTPSHQFPTGAIMPIAKRLNLAEWSRRNNALIIEDDYCHLRYNIKPVPALHSVCDARSVVYLGTFSKILAPSLRLSYMVLPPALLANYRELVREYSPVVAFLPQKTLELFMKQGYWDRHLRKTVQSFKQRQEIMVNSLTRHFGQQVDIYGKNGGLHLLARIKCGLAEQELIAAAAQTGVRVYPVSRYWQKIENYSGDMVMFGFAGIGEQDIDKGVELLKQVWLG